MPGIMLHTMQRSLKPLTAVEAECMQASIASALSSWQSASQAAGPTGSLYLAGQMLTQGQLHLLAHVRLRMADGRARLCSRRSTMSVFEAGLAWPITACKVVRRSRVAALRGMNAPIHPGQACQVLYTVLVFAL